MKEIKLDCRQAELLDSLDIAALATGSNRNMDWQENAACVGQGDEQFMPKENERRPKRVIREAGALRFCGRCAVSDECLQMAVNFKDTYGVHGGLGQDAKEILFKTIGQYLDQQKLSNKQCFEQQSQAS